MFRQYSKANIPHTFLWAAETRVGLSRREEVEKSPLGREQGWGKQSDVGFVQDLNGGGEVSKNLRAESRARGLWGNSQDGAQGCRVDSSSGG